MSEKRRIAIIGGGIAGLSAAWLLRDRFEVTLFEAEARLGGHADTQSVMMDGQTIPVDTGFIVFNDENYPNLTGFFNELNVATQPSEMSFGVSVGDGAFEYGGGTLPQLFAQKRNLVNPRFLRMISDIFRFNRTAPALLDSASDETLGAYLERETYGPGFIEDHILPIGAAIWSSSLAAMREFPVRHFVRFFHNHGLLSVSNRPQWRTVSGGSHQYVACVRDALAGRVRLGSPVTRVERNADAVHVITRHEAERFDQAILACHADQALSLLTAPSVAEQKILGPIRFQENLAVLHTDISLMPKRRAVWSSWNYLAREQADQQKISLTYWMNKLQTLPTKTPLLVTLNPKIEPDSTHVLLRRLYSHPQFDAAALRAQDNLPIIQGKDRIWFTGAWTGWGFHEDGISASVDIAKALGASIPWRQARRLAA